MKKLPMALPWLALGLVIGSALEAVVGKWLAVAILVLVLVLDLIWLWKTEASE